MKHKKQKLIRNISICISSLFCFVPFITSCATTTTTKLFAELVVSDNSSVLKDKSFSETAYNGWRKFMMSNKVNPITGDVSTSFSKQEGSEYKKEFVKMPHINDKDTSLGQGRGYWRRPGQERSLTYKQIFKGGANLIIGPGFTHQTAVETVSRSSGYENKGFLLLDATPNIDNNKYSYPNVASFVFRAEQSGFLAGVAAAEFLNINQEVFDADGKLAIGGFVGLVIPTTIDFLSGFQHGVIAYNLDVDKMNKDSNISKIKDSNGNKLNRKPVEWIKYTNIANYASGSFASGDGLSKAQDLIRKGADVIMPVSGPQTIDVVSAISRNIDQRPVVVVGVDSAQEISSINKPLSNSLLKGKKIRNANMEEIDNPQIIQFSAIKKIDEATTKVLAAIFNKKDHNNEKSIDPKVVKGLGFNNIGSLANSTVGVSDPGLPYVKNAFRSWFKQNSSLDSNKQETLELNLDEIYKNVAFQRLEYNASFYHDQNLLEGDGFKSVESFKKKSEELKNKGKDLFIPLLDDKEKLDEVEKASKIEEMKNTSKTNPFDYFSPKSQANYSNGNSLDGSKWNPYKVNNVDFKYIKKEDELEYGK